MISIRPLIHRIPQHQVHDPSHGQVKVRCHPEEAPLKICLPAHPQIHKQLISKFLFI